MIRDLNEQALAVSESLTHLMGGLHIQLLAVGAGASPSTRTPTGTRTGSRGPCKPKSVNAPPQISSITLQSVEVYGLGVEQLGKTVDKCVDDTVALITKSDELNTNMAPIHELAAQMYAQGRAAGR